MQQNIMFFYVGGYGLKFTYGVRAGSSFACASEPADFGSYEEGKFSYTHYGINSWLTGTRFTRDGSDPYQRCWRRTSALYSPTTAMLFADSKLISSYTFTIYTHPGFRHGIKDPRPYTSSPTSPTVCRGKANMAFMDGHVAGATYGQFRAWKPERDETTIFTKPDRDPYLRGFYLDR